MTDRRCDIAIIGAGTAGLHAWKAVKDSGCDVLVIERGDGGSLCTRAGCIPSKLLIAAGRAAHNARRAATFGVDVGEVAIDGAAVMRRVRRMRDEANGKIADEFHAIPADRRVKGEARFVGPNTIAVGDNRIEAGRIIVATGSTPNVPPSLDPVRALVHTNETIFDLETLPASLAVLGAGPLGLELAQAFARLGVAVTVFDEGDTIGALSDREAEDCARAALCRDVTFHMGVSVTAANSGDKARLSWDGGAIEVDLILAATGRSPALDALDIRAGGVALDDKGRPAISETTRRHADTPVFVAGDANGWRPVLHEAARGGRIAGEVATGSGGSRTIPDLKVAFTEPNLVEVGTAFAALPDDAVIGTARASDTIRAEIDDEDEGVVRLYADAKGQLLGGTIVWTGGEHLGQSLAIAIGRGMDAATFADQPWYHPVIEEALQSAARDILGKLG